MSIISKETIFIYISIYEEYTALCYACILYLYEHTLPKNGDIPCFKT